jgi:hypothetical protein
MDIEIPCSILDWIISQAVARSAVIWLHSDIEDRNGRAAFNVDERVPVGRSWDFPLGTLHFALSSALTSVWPGIDSSSNDSTDPER